MKVGDVPENYSAKVGDVPENYSAKVGDVPENYSVASKSVDGVQRKSLRDKWMFKKKSVASTKMEMSQ